jgi:exportin-1
VNYTTLLSDSHAWAPLSPSPLLVPPAVSTFLVRGADLMLAGVLVAARGVAVLVRTVGIVSVCRSRADALIPALTAFSTGALFALPPAHLKLVMDSIVWAFRHTERNVAETGLALLMDLLHSFSQSEHCNAFFSSYYLSLTQEVFAVMTDSFHNPGFKMHAQILQHLFCMVDGDGPAPLSVPLWDVAAQGPAAYASNGAFVREHVTQLLSSSFPNMAPPAVAAAVAGMFDTKKDFTAFKNHMRDFLVQT